MKKIEVFAPATVANVTCGFDIMGFAIESIGDKVILTETNNKEIKIVKIHGADNLPYDSNKNIVTHVINKVLSHLKIENIGIDVEIFKGIEPGSGLGSSSASSAAACFAINEFLGNPLSVKELIPFAMEGERLASGSAHADNVAPALLGGFVLVRSYNPLDIIPIDFPTDLYCTVIHPKIELRTELSRNILRKNITLKTAVEQWGNIAGLVAGLMKSDYQLISNALNDVIVEPVRSVLIPKFDEIKKQSIENGALGCGISGSGPSIFCLTKGKPYAERVSKKMREIYSTTGINFDIFISPVSNNGTKLII